MDEEKCLNKTINEHFHDRKKPSYKIAGRSKPNEPSPHFFTAAKQRLQKTGSYIINTESVGYVLLPPGKLPTPAIDSLHLAGMIDCVIDPKSRPEGDPLRDAIAFEDESQAREFSRRLNVPLIERNTPIKTEQLQAFEDDELHPLLEQWKASHTPLPK